MTNASIQQFLNELKELAKSESVPCVGGRSDLPTQPGLNVKGRPISLPVNQQELEWLCEQGQPSPFGKGMDTVLDTNIRRSIEFEAKDVKILNPNWKSALEKLVGSISNQMQIDFTIQAELFKLLVYREGGHFKFHQDTEKTLGMFATLIVQLPSRCQGGSLTCRFADKEYRYDFGNKDAGSEFCIYYAAHYADVHHQVEKINEGTRLVLIYNLIQPATLKQLSASHHKQCLDSASARVPAIFSRLSQKQHALLLQHEYTKQSLSELGFGAAKGQDRSLILALLAINKKLPLEYKLYFMITRVSYTVTSDGSSGGGYYGKYDDDECDWEEIKSSQPGCDLCFDEAGQTIPTDDFTVDWVHDLNDKEVNSMAFNEIDEDFWGEGSDDIEGFMGNYGPTKETTYARYLLVVMPAYPTNTDGFSQDAVFQAHRISLMAQDLRMHPNCDWLQKRLELALKDVLVQFNTMVSEKEDAYHWNNGFDESSQSVFAKLLKTAIDTDDDALCQRVISTANERLLSSLSSEYQHKYILSPLKEAIDHFGWETLSTLCTPIFNALSGNISWKIATTLAENNADSSMRAELMGICVEAVCREQNSWGEKCSFTETLLPLAINICKTAWHVPQESKNLFLTTCLKQGEDHPSFLSVLIQKLINDTQADDNKWLLPALVTARLHYLKNDLKTDVTLFTWSMPQASVQNNSITAFLRGDSQQTHIAGYDGIAMARNDVVSVESQWILPEYYMESNGVFLPPEINYGFSASMDAKGRGKKAYIEIKKDKRYHELSLKLRQLRKQELNKLQKFMDHFQIPEPTCSV